MKHSLDYLSSNISNWNDRIDSKELWQLEYIQKCSKEELKKHTKTELKKLYDVLLKQEKAYFKRKNPNDYLVRLQKKVLFKLKWVIWKYVDKYKKIKKHRNIHLKHFHKEKYAPVHLVKNISFKKETLLDEDNLEISRKINFRRTNDYIWNLFRKYWNENISLEKIEKLENMYYQSFYNEFFLSNNKINKPLLKSVQEYYMYRKQWDQIFEANLWMFMSSSLAQKFEILWYVESYFWKNNNNKIAKWPFQFTENTWNTYDLVDRTKHILVDDYRNDPLKSADAASKHLRDLFFKILIKRHKLEKADILDYEKIKIKSWDSFFWLARKYNVNTSVIIWFNKIMWNNIKNLVPWQEIYIPTKIRNLQEKVNTEDMAFVLSIYNWWLYDRLRIKNVNTINEYINILKRMYNDYKYVVFKSKSSYSLLHWVKKVNSIYFKHWRWLFTHKWEWISKLKHKSLNYKKRFILRHMKEVILQQSSYFWKFMWAVKFFNYLQDNKEILEANWLVFGWKLEKIDFNNINLASYLSGEHIDFYFKWKSPVYLAINTPNFTFQKFVKTFDWLADFMKAGRVVILVEKEKYIVKRWDSLIKIYKKFNLKEKRIYLNQFRTFNNLLTNNLQVWQVLLIPKKKYQLLSQLSKYEKDKYLKYKLLQKLKEKYIIRSCNITEGTKPKKEFYILKK